MLCVWWRRDPSETLSVLSDQLLTSEKRTDHCLLYHTNWFLSSHPPSPVSWSQLTQTPTSSYNIKNFHDVLKTFETEVEKKL